MLVLPVRRVSGERERRFQRRATGVPWRVYRQSLRGRRGVV